MGHSDKIGEDNDGRVGKRRLNLPGYVGRFEIGTQGVIEQYKIGVPIGKLQIIALYQHGHCNISSTLNDPAVDPQVG